LNQTGVTITTHGANGTAITNYDWFIDAAGTVLANNFIPNAHIVAPRTVTSLSKLKEATTNAYMVPPTVLLPLLPTRQVPITNTTGTSTDTSEIYTAQWDQCWIGLRTNFNIRFLQERFADWPIRFLGELAGRRPVGAASRVRGRYRSTWLAVAVSWADHASRWPTWSWSHPNARDRPMHYPERGPATTDAAIPARIVVTVDTWVIRTDLGANRRTFVAANTAVPVGLESFQRVPA
jgi:hypothetical protein